MSKNEFLGFPDLIQDFDDLVTRPMPLHELPLDARIDHELSIISLHHDRIAKMIQMSWGHQDCMDYMQTLMLSGGDGVDRIRSGFSPDVVTAIMNLTAMHDVAPKKPVFRPFQVGSP